MGVWGWFAWGLTVLGFWAFTVIWAALPHGFQQKRTRCLHTHARPATTHNPTTHSHSPAQVLGWDDLILEGLVDTVAAAAGPGGDRAEVDSVVEVRRVGLGRVGEGRRRGRAGGVVLNASPN